MVHREFRVCIYSIIEISLLLHPKKRANCAGSRRRLQGHESFKLCVVHARTPVVPGERDGVRVLATCRFGEAARAGVRYGSPPSARWLRRGSRPLPPAAASRVQAAPAACLLSLPHTRPRASHAHGRRGRPRGRVAGGAGVRSAQWLPQTPHTDGVSSIHTRCSCRVYPCVSALFPLSLAPLSLPLSRP
jgi:hypothetical protein